MKRVLLFFFALSIIALGALSAVPLIERENCLRRGAFPSSIDKATLKLGTLVFVQGKGEWEISNISEADLLHKIRVLEVAGPSMGFEHASARYVTFELSNCPGITMPITKGIHCGQTTNLGWIAGNCLKTRS